MLPSLLLLALVSAAPRAQSQPPVPTTEAALCRAVARTDATPAARAAATARATGSTAAAAFMSGCLAMGQGKPDKGAEHFERATEREATRSLYFDWLGRAYGDQALRANKLRQAMLARKTKAAFERAVALDADNLDARSYLVDYYQLAPGFMGGSEAKATEQMEAIRARNAYVGGFTAATVKTRRKDLAGAEREYAALVRSHPDSLAPRVSLLSVQITASRWADAFRTLDAARATQPDARVLGYIAGRLSALSGQRLEAGEAALRQYLAAPPKAGEPALANAHFRLGQVLQHRGDVAGARRELQTAVSLDPKLTDAKTALAGLK